MPKSIVPLELFQRVKNLWPRSVELGNDPLKALSDIYWPIDEILADDDDWLRLGIWAFHQGLYEIAEVAANSASTIVPRDMEFSTFDRWMRFNLEADDDWAEELAEWQAKQ